MNLRQIILFVLSVSLIIGFSSCMGAKSTSSGRPEKYVQIFYTDADATQYFVKPLHYESESTYDLMLDFTLRDSVENPPVRMLFSVMSEEAVSGHKTCFFGLDSENLNPAEKVFAEPVKDGFKYRYEIIIGYDIFVKMVRETSSVVIKIGETEMSFTPDKNALKAFPHIERSTITMLETR